MLIAQEKKKSNIAEYLLYMWQVEDLIRANHFDPDSIFNHFISKFELPDEKLQEIKNWYANLAQMMIDENIKQKGHCQYITNQLNDLIELHHTIINNRNDKEYIELYASTRPLIAEYSMKTGLTSAPEIEVCFIALYSFLLLKLKKANFSTETIDGTEAFSKLIAQLSRKYHLFEAGKINFDEL